MDYVTILECALRHMIRRRSVQCGKCDLGDAGLPGRYVEELMQDVNNFLVLFEVPISVFLQSGV